MSTGIVSDGAGSRAGTGTRRCDVAPVRDDADLVALAGRAAMRVITWNTGCAYGGTYKGANRRAFQQGSEISRAQGSPDLSRWESQNATSVDSPVGRRNLTHQEGESHVLVLTRRTKTNDWAGPQLCTSSGRRSTSSSQVIDLSRSPRGLRHAMPADIYRPASMLA
jgi:hypothetical protein